MAMTEPTPTGNDFRKPFMVVIDLGTIMFSAVGAYLVVMVASWLVGVEYVTALKLVEERLWSLIATAACVCLYFLLSGHYHARMPFWEETRAVTAASLFALLVEGFIIYANKADVSRSSTFLTWAFAPFFIMWGRALLRHILLTCGKGAARAVVFGKSAEADRASAILTRERNLGIDVVAACDTTDTGHAVRMLQEGRCNDAVVALSCDDGAEIGLVADLRRRGYRITVIPPAMGMSASMNVNYVLGQDALMLVSRPEITPKLNRIAKRTFDIAVAGGLLMALALPMTMMAVIVAADGGPPFFSHRRIGRRGRPFGCLKFRSMCVDAERKLQDYLESDPEARCSWEKSRKLPDDPRITRIGHFLRRTSLDELPQLINVLRGDMSLVGPRPVTAPELDNYGEAADLYLAVRPGLTGLWQVSGRSDLSYERRVALDTWYVENWSPWHDIAILSKTVPVVLGRGGAY